MTDTDEDLGGPSVDLDEHPSCEIHQCPRFDCPDTGQAMHPLPATTPVPARDDGHTWLWWALATAALCVWAVLASFGAVTLAPWWLPAAWAATCALVSLAFIVRDGFEHVWAEVDR